MTTRHQPNPGDNAAARSAASTAAAGVERGTGLTKAVVGPRCANLHDDVETVQHLLNLSAARHLFRIDDGALKPDGDFGRKTLDAILAFQRDVEGERSPAGVVKPGGSTLRSLCRALPDDVDTDLLTLLYLRAAETEVRVFAPELQRAMATRAIDTPLRRAHFLAQIGHESGELRFRAEIASGAAYEGRLDLGNTQRGDGPRFKGRGLIQLTGRANYSAYGRALGREAELLAMPQLLETDVGLCVDVAAWFWTRRGLNALADADDLRAITRRINGGFNGLEDRRRLLQRARSIFGC